MSRLEDKLAGVECDVTVLASSAPPLYPDLDPRELEPHFARHMLAMTAEDLHSKSAIAEQLAWRDQRLEAANAICAARLKHIEELQESLRLTQSSVAEFAKRDIESELRIASIESENRLLLERIEELTERRGCEP